MIGLEKKFDEVGDKFELDSRFNYALNYRLDIGERDKAEFSLGLVRGNTIFLNLAVHSNLNFSGTPRIVMGSEKIRDSTTTSYVSLNNDWKKYLTDTIVWEMGNVGFVTHNIYFNDNELAAEISQGRFLKTVQALDLASRILANNAPQNIDNITIINVDQGIETLRSTIKKEDLVNTVIEEPLSEEMFTYNLRNPFKPRCNNS